MGAFFALFIVYLFYTILSLIAAVNTPIADFFYGLLLMWLMFLSFWLGGVMGGRRLRQIEKKEFKINHGLLMCSAALSFACALYAAKFYTGSGLGEVLSAVWNGKSNYNSYQVYFAEASISAFSISKIPAIISVLVLKLTVVYGYASLFFVEAKYRNPYFIVYLLFVTASYLYFSLARGTSFEALEIFLLILFVLCVGGANSIIDLVFSKRTLVVVFLAGLAVSLYSYNVSVRYGENDVNVCMIPDMCFDEDALIAKFSPVLGLLTAKLSLYFLFGIYYLSHLVSYTLSEAGFFGVFFLPGASYMDAQLSPRFLCEGTLDCGASWAPSLEKFFYIFGLPGSFMVIFSLGVLVKKLSLGVSRQDPLTCSLAYFIFLLMISLPVGNFVTDSSSNLLSMLLLGGAVLFRSTLRSRGISIGIKK